MPRLNTLGSFIFELCSRQIDKQANRKKETDKQTDLNVIPSPMDSVGMDNNMLLAEPHTVSMLARRKEMMNKI